MRLGIIGLPGSGKTTVFSALTGISLSSLKSGNRKSSNLGVSRVPDDRIDYLKKVFNPRRTTYAEVTYVDFFYSRDVQRVNLFPSEVIGQLQSVEALIYVVRGFEAANVPHPLGSIDYRRDIEKIEFDIRFFDISLLDLRIDRIETGMKSLKASQRNESEKLVCILRRLQVDLETGYSLRDREMTEEESRAIADTFLLSRLPRLVALNIGDANEQDIIKFEDELEGLLPGVKSGGTAISGKLECEISDLTADEQTEMRLSFDSVTSGLKRMIQLSYKVLGLRSFITVGDDEVRAWTISHGTTARKAAGSVHSDIERGFIRAEVVGYHDFFDSGSIVESRRKGLLRQEGQNYIIRDGDIVNFLFSV